MTKNKAIDMIDNVVNRKSGETQENRLDALLQVSQKLVEAGDEREVIDLVLRLSVDLTNSIGATYIPLDEHHHPAGVIALGDQPESLSLSELEYLANPSVRSNCANCTQHSSLTNLCPLISGPFESGENIFCLPIRRHEEDFGVLNLYLPDDVFLDKSIQRFLQSLADQTALAVEGIRLRLREMNSLRQLQRFRGKRDYRSLMEDLLRNIKETFSADFVSIDVHSGDERQSTERITLGSFPESDGIAVQNCITEALSSGKSVTYEKNGLLQKSISLMASPLVGFESEFLGVMIVGTKEHVDFSSRQLEHFQIISDQVSLIIKNYQQLADYEFRSTINERVRLAREIHDGLAQTLGYLKLQIGRMQNFLKKNDYERLDHIMQLSYKATSDAYLDVREAIDDLRFTPGSEDFYGWVKQIREEYLLSNDLNIVINEFDDRCFFPPEVQIQLVRMIQESLSNVRKHSNTMEVSISCFQSNQEIVLEIRDEGVGFIPEDIGELSRHGLTGMRERAELTGADLSIISKPGEGTIIRITIPKIEMETTA